MSEENHEMLTALLDTIYGNWLDKVSIAEGRESNFLFANYWTFFYWNSEFYAGKKREDIERFINEGVYQMERLKEEGWITDIHYDDEVQNSLL